MSPIIPRQTSGRAERPLIHRLVEIVGILAVAALAAFQTIGDWDFPWHLRVGEIIVTTGQVPRVDVLSWSFAGAPWTYVDAGSQVVLYLAYAAGGFTGIVALRALAVLAFAFTLRTLISAPLARACAPVALVGITILASPAAWLPRPLLAGTILLPALLCAQLLTLRPPAEPASSRTWFAPAWWVQAAIVAVWFQLHRSALIGLAFVFAFSGFTAAITALRPDSLVGLRRWALQSLLPVVVAGISGLCTVNGLSLYASTLALQSNEELQAAISEWQPLTWAVARDYYPWLLVLAGTALTGLIACLALHVRRQQWDRAFVCAWPLFVLGVLVWQASGAVRHAGLLAPASAVALAVVINALRDLLPPSTGVRPGLAMTLGLVIGVVSVHASLMHTWGTGLAPDRFPSQAIEFAAANELGPRVHNSFVYGGYVAWEGAHAADMRVLVDGRNETVYPIPFYVDCTRAQRDPSAFEALAGRFAGDWVLADNTPGREDFAFLFRDPRWAMVFWSEQAVIYAPRSEVPAGMYVFEQIDPAVPGPSLSVALERANGDPNALSILSDELSRMLQTSPTSLRALSLRLFFLHSVGQQMSPEFSTLWARVLAVHADHPLVPSLAEILGQSL
jgi:hypothetical protein